MLYAIVNNEKIEAKKGLTGKCPLCEQKLFPKCGEINIHHWSHYKNGSCESWYEPESEWHYHWKMTFGKDYTEVVLEKDGKKHFADIYTKNKVVIELQNSPISKKIIREREEFYGNKMLWIINGISFKERFEIKTENRYFEYDQKKRSYEISKNLKKYLRFRWSYPKKSWEESKRNIFFDFGDENLFWVEEGIDYGYGEGRYISKEAFIKKYGGNIKYYQEHFKR
ncbi:MAG: hypothetical protein GXO80_01905 [Chlorobi bacterium]|nr:hypothetical protein [Chlorobiota bacterium]